MSLFTAVLAGDNTLELRVLVDDAFFRSPRNDTALSAGLCRLMDRFSRQWRRYVFTPALRTYGFILFRSAGTFIWIENLCALPGYAELVRVLHGEGLSLLLADQSTFRYLDLYVQFIE